MTTTAYELRKRARETLGNGIFEKNWLMMLVITLIADLLLSFASSITFGIAAIIIGGPITFGLSSVLLIAVRTKDCKIENIFDGFKEDFSGNIILFILQAIFIFLWTLLFIIPGIIKSYSYSMAFYIKADHPDYDWKQCLDESRKMMDGNKFRLFCLELSFIGWLIVGSLCCGIGILWVIPYIETAKAHFYEDLKLGV